MPVNKVANGVGNGDRLEAAEHRAHRADRSDQHNGENQRGKLFDAEQLRHIEQLQDGDRARIEHAGNRDQAVADHEQDDRHAAHAVVEAVGEKLGQGGKRARQVARQKQERHAHRRERGGHFPSHAAQVEAVGGAVQADQLFGRKIGEQQRAGDEGGAETAAGEKLAVPGAGLAAGLAIGNPRHQRHEQYAA